MPESPHSNRKPANGNAEGGNGENRGAADGETEFSVKDRRHWVEEVEEATDEDDGGAPELRQPTLLEEYRERAEAAEQKLQEYIEAFKTFRDEQEQFRVRLNRDVDRRVGLKFGELIAALLESLDDLDLALEHANRVPEARALAEGVEMARRRFLGALERNGVQPISPLGQDFDPNESEAVRIDPVESKDSDGKVTETLRPGYRLGERVIRAARVAVGRHVGG